MKELKDYSGEFRGDIRLEDFSKDTLLRLLYATARQYLGIDAVWNSVVKEKFGGHIARDLEMEVWRRATSTEVLRTMGAMNIQGDDIAALLKVLQCAPGTAGIMDLDCEMRGKNHGILTVKRCSSLEYFERHGDIEGIRFACQQLETEVGYPETAHAVNPKIEVTPLKRPPRQSKDEIACQWEFKLET